MQLHEYSGVRWLCTTVLLLGSGCGGEAPDPRTVPGALAALAQALEAQDAARLFRLVDQRSRHALASIVTDRNAARRLISAEYPEPERAAALLALGDAATAATPGELFRRRCAQACMRELAALVGAPVEHQVAADAVIVRTSRGTTLHMHAGKDGWYGVVWRTRELAAERAQAARSLLQIRENAAHYRAQRALR